MHTHKFTLTAQEDRDAECSACLASDGRHEAGKPHLGVICCSFSVQQICDDGIIKSSFSTVVV